MAYKSISKKTEEDVEVVPVDADEAVPKVAAKPSVFADHFGVDIGYGAVKKHRSRLSRHRQVSVKHDLKLYKITTPA